MGMYDLMPTLGNMFGFYNKYALGHDIFDIKDQNIVIFPTGNWLTKDMYYNNQIRLYNMRNPRYSNNGHNHENNRNHPLTHNYNRNIQQLDI